MASLPFSFTLKPAPLGILKVATILISPTLLNVLFKAVLAPNLLDSPLSSILTFLPAILPVATSLLSIVRVITIIILYIGSIKTALFLLVILITLYLLEASTSILISSISEALF